MADRASRDVPGGRDGNGEDPLADLEQARAALADVEAELDEYGRETVEAVASAYRQATRLLDRYEESATGTGQETFRTYLQFQEEVASLVESVDDDLPAADAFDEAAETLDQRTLRESHFEEARETLAPAERFVDLVERESDVDERVREARHAARRELKRLRERADELETLEAAGEADLDAPVERVQAPVEAYNDAVAEEFERFKRTASARRVLSFVDATRQYPLVEYRQPPPELLEYVTEKPAGEESIDDLLEYADYSSSKLDHYVEDPGELRARVAVHRTYLERLDAAPLTVSWPPPERGVLRRRTRELVSVVDRFADEETVAALRRVRECTWDDEYDRIHRAATARADMTEAERERVQSGAVGEELAAVRDRIDRLETALEAE
jgi:hypothetical protein